MMTSAEQTRRSAADAQRKHCATDVIDDVVFYVTAADAPNKCLSVRLYILAYLNY